MKTFRSKSLIRGLAMILILASTIVVMVLQPGCKKEEKESYGNCETGFTFTSQTQIDNFQQNFPNCTQITGNVVIAGDPASTNLIANLNGLRTVTAIAGDLKIFRTGLTSLTGFEGLTSIGGDLLIGRYIHDGYYLYGSYSYGNPILKTLNGLDNLASVGGSLIISSNSTLSSLAGLNSLAYVGGNLEIGGKYYSSWPHGGNPKLMSLMTLNSLTSVGGSILIAGNGSLTHLTGLENISAGSIDSLYIFENSSLSTCAVQSICDYLANPNAWIEIHDNAPGCNSKAEVQAACDTLSGQRLRID